MTPKQGGSSRLSLSEDPLVRSWYDETALRSELSADTNVRKLSLLLERISLDPAGLLKLAREHPAGLRDRFVRYAKALKSEGRLDSYVAKTLDGARSFLAHHGVRNLLLPKLHIVSGESLRDERTPTQDELRTVVASLSLRGKVIALLLAHTGVRPGVIGSYKAEDGLRLRDLPEVKIGEDGVKVDRRPFLIRVPGKLSKTRREYVTFGSGELADELMAYLESRRKLGEKLSPESSVVTVAPRAKGNWLRARREFKGFVTTKSLIGDISSTVHHAAPSGTKFRVYVLRAYFSTRLLAAESETRGRVTRDGREEMLGHQLGVSGAYNLSKRLGPETIEDLRRQYAAAEPFLSTLPARTERGDEIQRIRRVMLAIAGYSQAELAKMDVGALTWDELAQKVEERVGSKAEAPPSQQVVSLERVEGLLGAGWEYVAPLGSDRAIVRVPEGHAPPSHRREPDEAPSALHR